MPFLNKFSNLLTLTRNSSSGIQTVNNLSIKPILTNRNPRNLERMRIGYKPSGYHLENPGKCYWHKLELSISNRYITATVHHYENGIVLQASTQEWSIKKQLYKCNDVSAYINLGRVFAERCLQCGLTEMQSNIEAVESDGKISLFLKSLQEAGVILKEPEQYKTPRAWDQHRPEKPWEVSE